MLTYGNSTYYIQTLYDTTVKDSYFTKMKLDKFCFKENELFLVKQTLELFQIAYMGASEYEGGIFPKHWVYYLKKAREKDLKAFQINFCGEKIYFIGNETLKKEIYDIIFKISKSNQKEPIRFLDNFIDIKRGESNKAGYLSYDRISCNLSFWFFTDKILFYKMKDFFKIDEIVKLNSFDWRFDFRKNNTKNTKLMKAFHDLNYDMIESLCNSYDSFSFANFNSWNILDLAYYHNSEKLWSLIFKNFNKFKFPKKDELNRYNHYNKFHFYLKEYIVREDEKMIDMFFKNFDKLSDYLKDLSIDILSFLLDKKLNNSNKFNYLLTNKSFRKLMLEKIILKIGTERYELDQSYKDGKLSDRFRLANGDELSYILLLMEKGWRDNILKNNDIQNIRFLKVLDDIVWNYEYVYPEKIENIYSNFFNIIDNLKLMGEYSILELFQKNTELFKIIKKDSIQRYLNKNKFLKAISG